MITVLLLNEEVEKVFDARSSKFVMFDPASSSAFIETEIGVNKEGELFSLGPVKGMLVGTATAIVGGLEAEERTKRTKRTGHSKSESNANSQNHDRLPEGLVIVQNLDRLECGGMQLFA
jgi:hypothetical protein